MSRKRKERSWKKSFELFLASGYDSAGWICDSKQQAKSVFVSGSKSVNKPDEVRLFRRGVAVYMIRENVDEISATRIPESVFDSLPWHVANFITSDYDFAGFLLRSQEEAGALLEASGPSCDATGMVASLVKDRALWHFRPRHADGDKRADK